MASGEVRFIRRPQYDDKLLRRLIDPRDGGVVEWPEDVEKRMPKLPPPDAPPEERQKAESKINLDRIGRAFHQFHDTYNSFPPAATNGTIGKGALSWRVALLPYLGEEKLFKQFKGDEPWDSPHNVKLLERMPKVYASPRGNDPPSTTRYQVFTGPNTPFPPGGRSRLQAITDGTVNTFLVVEGDKAVPWTKPEDLPFNRNGPLPPLGGVVPGGFHALVASGEVRFISRPPYPDDLLRNLIDPKDGNPFQWPD
jgi:hypothetical protein